eukprot:178120_1
MSPSVFILIIFFLTVHITCSKELRLHDSDGVTTVYSSCNGITDNGLYYIKPMPNLPVIPVICSNEYVMIDGSLDANLQTLPSYLSSQDYGRNNKYYTISSLDDLSTYRQWLLMADDDTKFNIAPNCMQCEPGQFGDNTVYYTDSHIYCFSAAITSGCIDDTQSANYHPESCNQCDVGTFPNDDPSQPWTKCVALHLSADHPINHDHISCVAHGLTFHPVISNVRDFCTCYQPLEDTGVTSYQIPIPELPLVTARHNDFVKMGFTIARNIIFDEAFANDGSGSEMTDQRDTNIVYLYNTDFVDGTLRIQESGTYVIMEDIVFNFNAPSAEDMAQETFSPNSIDEDELYWFPTHAQADIDGTYPGLYSYFGPFTLGFFAGIAIETSCVTIDLNGHSLSQHPLFYFQQRFFALIELASQPFVPGQGPANWGAGNAVYAEHVIIENGELGLTAHHGIHGNNNNDITIQNVNTKQFDVCGIQCNSCTNLVIRDVIIGPQNTNIPLLGRYTHARSFLPRLKQLMNEAADDEITFYNRATVTVSQLVYRLIDQMDMIYWHVNNGIEYDSDDEEWIASQKIFANTNGWMDGGSSYGLVVGGDGAQVVGIGARHEGTSDVNISNVEIYGIYNQVIEKMKYTGNFGATRLIFFDAIDWNEVSSESIEPSEAVYLGDAYSDLTFAVSVTVDSWYFMNSLFVSDEMKAYVFDGASATGVFHGGCGSDIQLHSSKGAIGFRVDGTQNLNVDGLYVHDVYNWADLGNQEWCGSYDGPNVGNEDIDIQYGYTGTRAHGIVMDYAQGVIQNVQIEKIDSYYGEANGFTVYKECDVVLRNINIDSVHAGTQVNDDDLIHLDLPNLIPRACGLDIRPNTVVTMTDDESVTIGDDISGVNTCYDDDTIRFSSTIATRNSLASEQWFVNNPSFERRSVNTIVAYVLIGLVFICGVFALCLVNGSYCHDQSMSKEDATELSPLLI